MPSCARPGDGRVSYRVAVMVSGQGTNLQALLDTVHRREAIEIVAVASNRSDAPALERARQARVQTGVFMANEYATRAERDALVGDWFEQKGVNLIVLAGFMEILSTDFVRRFRGRMITGARRVARIGSRLGDFPRRPEPERLAVARPGLQKVGQSLVAGDDREILEIGTAFRREAEIGNIEKRIHEVEHRLLPEAVRMLARGRVKLDPAGGRRVLFEEEAHGDD